ncbi:glycosyltransferase [Streptomyces phaeochromogenes]|uniref:glycosyltransferase n=1 Tax=Streptomyces phaeochromogenes TaxID=1923 RepID=UPI00386F0A7E
MTHEAMEAGLHAGSAADADRPLRIALLTYKGNPFCGGQGVYVRHLSRELARLGHQVEVIGSQPYPVLDEGEGLDGLSLTELPSLDLYRHPDPFRTPKRDEYRDWVDALEVGTMWTGGFPEPLTFSLRARRHLRARRGDFDVVHDNQTLGYGLLGDVGAPLVTTIHHPITVDRQLELDAAEGRRRRMSVRRWYAFTRMQKRVARRLSSVLTVSGTSRQEIVDHLGVRDDRIHVVHIGADTDLFSPDPSVPQVPGRIVTTSSADVPLKGLVFLVEALAKVRTEHPAAHLVVVGKRAEDGPVAQLIERYGLEGSVEFVKGISDAELVDLVRSAEVACVPSLYEGFSLPAAEAMATGTPLVATTGGAIPEVTGPDGETCLAVRPGDAGALAAGLSRLLGDPRLRERLGSAGRSRVLERFTWAKAAEGTVARYREAIASVDRSATRTQSRSAARTQSRSAAGVDRSAPQHPGRSAAPQDADPAPATPAHPVPAAPVDAASAASPDAAPAAPLRAESATSLDLASATAPALASTTATAPASATPSHVASATPPAPASATPSHVASATPSHVASATPVSVAPATAPVNTAPAPTPVEPPHRESRTTC